MSSIIKLSRPKGSFSLKVAEVYTDFEPEIEDEIIRESEEIERDEEQILREKMKAEFQKGYEEGTETTEKKLREEYEEQLDIQAQKINEFMTAVDEELKNYQEKFSDMVTALAMSVAKKIVNREIELESPLLENIKSVSQKLIGASYVLIKSNPAENPILQANSTSIFTEGGFSKIKFEEDERIDKGGFLIESDIGNIDGQISSQLAKKFLLR